MNKEKVMGILNCNTTKIILIVIIAIIGIIIIRNKEIKKYERIIDEKSPIIINQENKYGYINAAGKILIKPQYNSATRFYGNYAIVGEDDTYKIIDKKGKVKFENNNISKLLYISDYNVWLIDNVLYDSNLKRLSKKDLIVSYERNGIFKWKDKDNSISGLINYKGKTVFSYKYNDGESSLNIKSIKKDNKINSENTYCLISIDNKKYSLINCYNGKAIYKLSDDVITNSIDTIYEIRNSDKEFKERVLIFNGKKIYQTKDEDSNILNSNTYYTIKEKENEKYILKFTGKTVSEKPEDDSTLSEIEKYLGYTKFTCDEGFGVKKGTDVKIKCEYDRVKFFDIVTSRYLKSKGKYYVLARKDKKYYLVNLKNGKTVDTFNTDNISTYSISMFISYNDLDSQEKIVYSLKNGKKLSFDLDSKVTLYENYFTVENDNIEYYNYSMKKVYTIKK